MNSFNTIIKFMVGLVTNNNTAYLDEVEVKLNFPLGININLIYSYS